MSRNPYEYPNEWEAGGEPIEDEPTVVEVCRNCGSHEGPFNHFNGWPWCRETCYREVSALAMDQVQREREGHEQAARADDDQAKTGHGRY